MEGKPPTPSPGPGQGARDGGPRGAGLQESQARGRPGGPCGWGGATGMGGLPPAGLWPTSPVAPLLPRGEKRKRREVRRPPPLPPAPPAGAHEPGPVQMWAPGQQRLQRGVSRQPRRGALHGRLGGPSVLMCGHSLSANLQSVSQLRSRPHLQPNPLRF